MKNIKNIAILTIFCLSFNIFAQNRHNSVRMAIFLDPVFNGAATSNLPSNYLDRIKAAGYTHVQFPVELIDTQWAGGQYTATFGERDRLTKAFLDAHGKGIKVVPLLPSANIWSSRWNLVHNPQITYEPIYNQIFEGQANNSAIGNSTLLKLISSMMTAFKFDNDLFEKTQAEISVSTVPSYADDSSGFSRSYTSLIRDVVRAAFVNSGLPDSEFTFINMANDEPVIYSPTVEKQFKALIGKSQEDLRWIYERDPVNHFDVIRWPTHYDPSRDSIPFETTVYYQNYVVNLSSLTNGDRIIRTDPDFYYSFSYTDNYLRGVQALYADFYRRRVQEIKNELPNITVITYADMLDPQHTGGYLGTAGALDTMAHMNILVGGIPEPMNRHLILMPWLYPNTYTHHLEGTVEEATVNNLLENVINPDWWLCATTCSINPFCLWLCRRGISKFITVISPDPIDADISLSYNATGYYYNADSSVNHFIRNGFRFMYNGAFQSGGEMLANTLYQNAKMMEAPYKLSPAQRDSFCLGYSCASYEENRLWDSTADFYDQDVQYNSIELLPAFSGAVHGDSTRLFMNDMRYLRTANIFGSVSRIRAIDYLAVNRNFFDPRCNRVDRIRDSVSFFDAIIFCNNLSKKEGFDTAYTYSTISFNNQLDYGRPQVTGITGLAVNTNRSGYRLPTLNEIRLINLDTNFIKNWGSSEWIWSGDTVNRFVVFYPRMNDTLHIGSSTPGCAFRVVRRNRMIPNLTVYSRDEGLAEGNISKPRIYIQNGSSIQLSNFTVHYYFSIEAGRIPVVDPYWTPNETVTMNRIKDSLYEVQYQFHGMLDTGNLILPSSSGNVVGIHYTNWSSWNKTNDYSFNNSTTFLKNEKIVVTDNNGFVVYGIVPDISLDTIKVPPPDTGTLITASGNRTVTTSWVTLRCHNPYYHGMMFTVRNAGQNDSVTVQWQGVLDQNNSNCQPRSVNLFGNGAQINNVCTPKDAQGNMFIRIKAKHTCTVQLEIFNWSNGTGCL
jgi:hypothetical protein